MSIVSLLLLACLELGCTNAANGTNANSAASSLNSNGNGNTNAGPRSSGSQAAIDIKEPERYSVSMTISAQAVSDAPSPMATQQFGFAKLGADRRWTFLLPAPIGQTVYLEKSGLKYLVLLDRKQYVELMPDGLGFQVGSALTPGAIAERLKSRAHDQLGLDTINGRTAIKYRLNGVGDASRQAEGMIFVDQETGLPLRCEMNLVLPAGTRSRVIVEARDVQLSPDLAQFDVPAGMKKVSPQEARQQVEGFAAALRLVADIMSGAQPAALAETAQPNANKNASGRTR